uniref:Uncharacterized protein n=1 Tax=Oryzias sinensis TaxID=183150 RepID=A0A8C7Y746_9TELE
MSENALLHGKSLLVVTSYNQGITYLPLISQRVSSHLSGHTLLIEGPVAGNEMFSYRGKKGGCTKKEIPQKRKENTENIFLKLA